MMVIENDHQLQVSLQRLAELKAAVERLRKKYPNPREFEILSLGAREHIEQIEREIAEYLAAKEPAKVQDS